MKQFHCNKCDSDKDLILFPPAECKKKSPTCCMCKSKEGKKRRGATSTVVGEAWRPNGQFAMSHVLTRKS